jgi:ADP-dependent NAD(P)H-hydrate dehydratase / NAD(P)H-hydrate epimerase
MNRATGRKLAVDIPSGLHGDTGAVLGEAVVADVTVTFAGVKVGMTVGEGPRCCGRIVVEGLGLPQ